MTGLTTGTGGNVLTDMASRYHMQPAAFEQTVRATCGCNKASAEQFAAFLLVANEYGLNPITREIYAFPTRGGGIQPIVSIDGWMSMANNHPHYDGITFSDRLAEDGTLMAITAHVHRKDRSHPIEVTEYLAECRQGTEPWKKWPARMLRHKAAIQAIRYAFGFSGIADPDEADRMRPTTTVTAATAHANTTTLKLDQPKPQAADDAAVAKAIAAIDVAETPEQVRKYALAVQQKLNDGFYTAEQAADLLDRLDERAAMMEEGVPA
jgi:phage recombination protein Bet